MTVYIERFDEHKAVNLFCFLAVLKDDLTFPHLGKESCKAYTERLKMLRVCIKILGSTLAIVGHEKLDSGHSVIIFPKFPKFEAGHLRA